MAYVRDDYGRIIAYRADEKGEKIPVRSICVGENGGAPSIYKDKQSADDENGLPVYYKNGEPVWKEERWVTGESTGPDGKEEGMDEAHVIPLERTFYRRKAFRLSRDMSRLRIRD